VKFGEVLERFIADKRFSSASSERHYRDTLVNHAEDAEWRDPRMTTREDVKRTLRRWSHPNTAANRLSILSSFYEWMTREGLRKDNPAHQVQKIRRRDPETRRLTHAETLALLGGCETRRERWAVYLAVCAGLRSAELRGLKGRHFKRPGFVWVSSDIAKGKKERWVPVVSELEPIVAEVQEQVDQDEYVLPAQRKRNPGKRDKAMLDFPQKPSSPQSLWRLVKKVGDRVHIDVNPHALRHAYADHLTRFAGIWTTKALMGHRDIGTTQGYLGKPTLDELQAAVSGFRFDPSGGSEPKQPENPLIARRGFEPLTQSEKALERTLASIRELAAEKVPLYVNALGELERKA
jgi:site-specific recombinase XerD